MEVILTNLQKQVDSAIDARISRICQAAYKKANILANGRSRKKHAQYTLPAEVDQLLGLRQLLYSGYNPESIMAEVTNGAIQDKFLKSI